MISRFFLLFLIIFIISIPEIQAKGKPILSYFPIEGTGEVIQNNQAIAREQAINNALANILESVIGKILTPVAIAENYLLLQNNIFSKSGNFIQGYKVISEKFDPREKSYKVTLNVNIFISDLRNNLVSLGLLFTGKKTDRVLIIIEEKETENQKPLWDNNSFMETLLLSKLTDDGIIASDRQILKGIIEPKEIPLLKRNDLRILSFLRTQTDTELIIWGETMVSTKPKSIPISEQTPNPEIDPNQPTEPEFESKGMLGIKIIAAKKGETISEKNEEVTIGGTNEEVLKILTLMELNENIFPFLIEEIRKVIPREEPKESKESSD